MFEEYNKREQEEHDELLQEVLKNFVKYLKNNPEILSSSTEEIVKEFMDINN